MHRAPSQAYFLPTTRWRAKHRERLRDTGRGTILAYIWGRRCHGIRYGG